MKEVTADWTQRMSADMQSSIFVFQFDIPKCNI